MLRSVFLIAWAIGLSQPSMAAGQRESYARAIVSAVAEQKKAGETMDPFTLVAIIHHESRWRSGVISRDGEDYGLGQIRARFERPCRKDADPLRHPSKACQRAKTALLNGNYNIRRVARHISEWRRTCRKITGRSALMTRWLHGYGGMGRRKASRWTSICGQRKTKRGWVDLSVRKEIRNIMKYRKTLIRKSKKLRRKS